MNNTQDLIEYFNQLPRLIKGVWYLSGVLFGLILLLVGYLKFYRNDLRKTKIRIVAYEEKFELLIVTYLYAGTSEGVLSLEQESILKELRPLMTSSHKREVFISSLLKLSNEISGEMADAIQDFYERLGLLKYAKYKLKSAKWHIAAQAIREFTQFKIKEVYDDVLLLVNHDQPEVRKEVQLYVVDLFHFKGLSYLNDLKTSLSEWDQIQLLEILQRYEGQKTLNILPWLLSKNDSVVLFALKLAGIYRQFEVKDTLVELINHSNQKIRVEGIKCLSQFYAIDIKDELKATFENRSLLEQQAILDFLENLYDNQDELFIRNYINHEDFEIRLKSLRILKLISTKRFESLKEGFLDKKYMETLNFVEKN